MMRCRHFAMVAGVVAALVSTGVHAALRYRVQDLGTLPDMGSFSQISATAINGRGWATGYVSPVDSSIRDTAFLYREGEMQRLIQLSNEWATYGQDINDRGQVVGMLYNYRRERATPFIYNDGRITDLSTSIGKDLNGWANGINAQGHATGMINGRAFIWNGVQSRYIDIPDSPFSQGFAINDHGVVLGVNDFTGSQKYSAFLYDGTNTTLLPPVFSDYHEIVIMNFNNAGQIAISVDHDHLRRSYFYVDGKYQDMGDLGGILKVSQINGLNDQGWAVGYAFVDVGSGSHMAASLYRDGHMQKLNDLLTPQSAERWDLMEASDINNKGQILGMGRTSIGGELHAFIATPVPEPGSWLLMMAGLAMVGWRSGWGKCSAIIFHTALGCGLQRPLISNVKQPV